MELITLEYTEIQCIVDVLNESFADYIVPLQLEVEQLKQKIAAENIRLEWSIGVVAEGRLVGFMLHALDVVDGQKMAYNAATGVVPAYRGQGLVAQMYDEVLPKLKALEVEQLLLEVIVGNDSAIRAYEKMGYHVHRTLDCFKGVVSLPFEIQQIDIRVLPDLNWKQFSRFWTVKPAWQSSSRTLDNSSERCAILGAYQGDTLIGYLIYYPAIRRIQQLAVAPNHRRKGVATQLIKAMTVVVGTVEWSINNVDHNADDVLCFLQHLGWSSHLSQYEMKRAL